ncbi:MAG: extra-cytoplasmic solute receptor protein [Betaproteobacteria bacterium]|jgi:tripartite-type tricarboxylate transporter receptor subunit TctC|nr:extra-cytoplasmic solute receptor protein [Betaproteobacteria bacterium]
MRRAASFASLMLAFSAMADAVQETTSTGSGHAFPSRPVRMIVSNTPGSAPDVVGRLVGAKLTEAWGQQIVIDNRPGATGLIAAETLARAAPDGYTLWLNTMTQLISTLQYQRHMLAKEFAPVSLVASTPFVIVVPASLPVKSLAEWIAYAKARPGQLIYGSGGQWGSSHLCMEALTSMAGINLVHVPYKGSTIVLSDIVAGRIHAYCPAAPSLPAFAQTGKVRTLGVTYQKPTPLAPGVPPVADTLPGFELLGWYGLQAPLHTPSHIVSRINLDLVKALKSPELQERLFAVGAEAVGSTPAEFGTFLQKETERWAKVLRQGGTIPAAGTKPDRE